VTLSCSSVAAQLPHKIAAGIIGQRRHQAQASLSIMMQDSVFQKSLQNMPGSPCGRGRFAGRLADRGEPAAMPASAFRRVLPAFFPFQFLFLKTRAINS